MPAPHRPHRLRHVAGLLGLLTAASLTGCGSLQLPEEITEAATSSSSDVPAADEAAKQDYFTVLGPAKREHEISETGTIEYCPLDDLQRAVCAYGLLTEPASGDSDGDLVDPTGWPEDNREVDIPALKDVEGSKPYHGWMMNRSHLIADSLGGKETPENLVTGTRTQNVGSTQVDGQYAGGMAHTEKLARDYLASGAAKDCPLYYAATPRYTGSELVPRTVTVDIVSCDEEINQRVEVSNTAAGWSIDYGDGSYEKAV